MSWLPCGSGAGSLHDSRGTLLNWALEGMMAMEGHGFALSCHHCPALAPDHTTGVLALVLLWPHVRTGFSVSNLAATVVVPIPPRSSSSEDCVCLSMPAVAFASIVTLSHSYHHPGGACGR